EFDTVHVFTLHDTEIEYAAELSVGKMRNGFFFLSWLKFEIHAPVVVFAKLGMQRRQQLAKRFAVPGHQLREEQGGDGRVALGKIEARADAAAFLAANQNVLLQH